jgi:mRNA interferase MazF
MRDIQPFLVLSPGAFNVKKSLVIGLSTTMATHTADNPFAVDVGDVSKRKVNKRSDVLCHQPKFFDWRARGAKAHPLGALNSAMFAEVCGG